MLLCLSSGVFEGVVDLSGYVVFEAADGFFSGFPFAVSLVHVLDGSGVVLETGENNPVERCVGLPVSATVESVSFLPA